MPKGYVISRVDITDPEAYARYAAAATKAIADHGGKPLARGGRSGGPRGQGAGANFGAQFQQLGGAPPLFPFRAISGGARPARGSRRNRDGSGRWSLTMPKGYWIGRVDVHDPEIYQQYVKANAVAFAKFGARFLVRGGKHVVASGKAPARNVVIEFRDYETALACHDSPE